MGGAIGSGAYGWWTGDWSGAAPTPAARSCWGPVSRRSTPCSSGGDRGILRNLEGWLVGRSSWGGRRDDWGGAVLTGSPTLISGAVAGGIGLTFGGWSGGVTGTFGGLAGGGLASVAEGGMALYLLTIAGGSVGGGVSNGSGQIITGLMQGTPFNWSSFFGAIGCGGAFGGLVGLGGWAGTTPGTVAAGVGETLAGYFWSGLQQLGGLLDQQQQQQNLPNNAQPR